MKLPEIDIIRKDLSEATVRGLDIRRAASETNLRSFTDHLGKDVGVDILRACARYKRNIVTVSGPSGCGKTSWATALAGAAKIMYPLYGANVVAGYILYDKTHRQREEELGKTDKAFVSKAEWATSPKMLAEIRSQLSQPLADNEIQIIIAEFVNLQEGVQERGEDIVPTLVSEFDVHSQHVALTPNRRIQEITIKQRNAIRQLTETRNLNMFLLAMEELGLNLRHSVKADNFLIQQKKLKIIVDRMGDEEAIHYLRDLLARKTQEYVREISVNGSVYQNLKFMAKRQDVMKHLPMEVKENPVWAQEAAEMMLYWKYLHKLWKVADEASHVLIGNVLGNALIPSLLEEIGPLYETNDE